MFISTDQSYGAMGIYFADSADGSTCSHPAANDQVGIVRHGFFQLFLRLWMLGWLITALYFCFALFLIFFKAEPLCMAMWSVLSLAIKYCGSSFEA